MQQKPNAMSTESMLSDLFFESFDKIDLKGVSSEMYCKRGQKTMLTSRIIVNISFEIKRKHKTGLSL
jgi:hypothetical protein